MASIVPSISSVARRMTSGERRLAQRLESHLGDEAVCWYDVPIGGKGRHPDFLVLHPQRGLLVLELKDWSLGSIHDITPLEVTLRTGDRLKKVANPLEQARHCAFAVCRLLEDDPVLLNAPGTRYEGKLVFPWGYGVVLSNITRKAFAASGLERAIPAERVMCKDEMAPSVGAEDFQNRLWGMFTVAFPCRLTDPEIDRIRWHLYPEVRVFQGDLDLEGEETPEGKSPANVVAIMDLRQEELARSIGEGHRVIHGVAGSGKTMILAYRAQQLAQELAKPVLVLCYNSPLAEHLAYTMRERGLSEKVHVRTFHSWCGSELHRYRVRQPDPGPGVHERLVQAVISAVEQGQIPRGQYGAVLIDEAHDFEPEWLKLAVEMVDPQTQSLLVLYDDAQKINGSRARLKFSLAEVGVQARGRTTILHLNYRNPAEIMAVACDFARDLLTTREASADGIPLVVPRSAGRRGALPQLCGFPDERKEVGFIVDQVRANQAKGRKWREVAILYRFDAQGERICEALRAAGIPVEWLKSQGRDRYQPGEDSVKVMSMRRSKGLEFPVVIIPFLESMPYAKEDPKDEAKLLYVAMTRATQRLLFTHHRESAFVERIREALARVGRTANKAEALAAA